MKISILLTDGAKQVMLTPETDHEKQALKMIQPDDTLHAVSKWGSFGEDKTHYNMEISECRGGYFREFKDRESLMFVIRDKQEAHENR